MKGGLSTERFVRAASFIALLSTAGAAVAGAAGVFYLLAGSESPPEDRKWKAHYANGGGSGKDGERASERRLKSLDDTTAQGQGMACGVQTAAMQHFLIQKAPIYCGEERKKGKEKPASLNCRRTARPSRRPIKRCRGSYLLTAAFSRHQVAPLSREVTLDLSRGGADSGKTMTSSYQINWPNPPTGGTTAPASLLK